MLVLIIGENGSGKTFIMTIFALSVLWKNILANYTINHPHFRFLELDDFLHIDDNTDVFIDEAYTWLENRRSSKATNVFITEIKEQKRKTHSTWYVSEQREKMIDLRFERFYNVLIECKTRYPIGNSTQDFLYKITYEDRKYPVYKRFKYESAKKYFNYFDTYEKVPPQNKQLLEYHMIKENPDKLFNKVIEIAKIIEKSFNGNFPHRITHPQMKWICLQNKIILQYEEYLYLYFQNKIEKLKNNEKK